MDWTRCRSCSQAGASKTELTMAISEKTRLPARPSFFSLPGASAAAGFTGN